jgi:hypothetical protein
MNNIFLLAGIVSVVFFIFKFVEMKYIEKEPRPLKYMIRDSLFTHLSVVAGGFLVDQLKPVIVESGGAISSPPVFTDTPGF